MACSQLGKNTFLAVKSVQLGSDVGISLVDEYLTRTGRFHPKLRDEVLAALESCQAHHEAAAKIAQRAEARMEDVAAARDAQLEATHGH